MALVNATIRSLPNRCTQQPIGVVFGLLLTIASALHAAPVSEPRFADYPSQVAPEQQPARLRLTNGLSRRYASALRNAADGPINFAGHHVLATIGCGAGCVVAGAIDKRTGRVAMLPFTVSDWPMDVTEPLEFHADSRLLVVRGRRGEQAAGTYFYAFDDERFRLLRAAPASR